MQSIMENPEMSCSAGKGHEDYQETKVRSIPMDERVLIAEILQEDKERADK